MASKVVLQIDTGEIADLAARAAIALRDLSKALKELKITVLKINSAQTDDAEIAGSTNER
jgi:hypothetical protein